MTAIARFVANFFCAVTRPVLGAKPVTVILLARLRAGFHCRSNFLAFEFNVLDDLAKVTVRTVGDAAWTPVSEIKLPISNKNAETVAKAVIHFLPD